MSAKNEAYEAGAYAKILNFYPEDPVIIGLDTDDGPDHPLYDPRIRLPLDDSTVKNVMALGVIQTITITNVNGKPTVVDGRRRVMHAREANKRLTATGAKREELVRVPCRVQDRTRDPQSLFAISISANSHRVQDGPVTEARKAAKMEGLGASDDDICISFGWSIGTLRNRRKLLTLSSKILDMVESGKLTVTAALELKDKPPEEADRLADEAAEHAEREGTTRGQAPRTRNAANEGTEDRSAPMPGKRLLQNILATDAAAKLSEDVRKVLKWMCGDLPPERIGGMKACIDEIEGAREEAAREAAAKKAERAAAKAAASNRPKPPTNKPGAEKGGKAGKAGKGGKGKADK